MATISIAGESDVSHLADLRRRWNEEQSGHPIVDPEFEHSFHAWWEAERGSRTFFLAAVGGTPVGMANVKHYVRMPVAGRTAGSWGYVGNVFVVTEHRDQHIGAELMEAIIHWAAALGLAHLRLAPSPRSIPFYERLGFRPGAVVDLDPTMGE